MYVKRKERNAIPFVFPPSPLRSLAITSNEVTAIRQLLSKRRCRRRPMYCSLIL